MSIVDGKGNDVTGRLTFTSPTTARALNCGAHVPVGGKHARVGVASGVVTSYAVSAWSVAEFEFQSCREARTPTCQ